MTIIDRQRRRFAALAVLVAGAAATRLLPHPPNVTPIGAMALLGGACIPSTPAAFLVPLAAMLLSDAVIGFHDQMPAVYACFALTVGLGRLLRRRRRPAPVALAALASSILFFVGTNLGVWAAGTIYPRTLAGLAACYTAALPFFRNSLLGDGLYAAALFGGYVLLERALPAIGVRGRIAG